MTRNESSRIRFKTTEMGEVIKQAEALQEKVKGLQQAQGQAR